MIRTPSSPVSARPSTTRRILVGLGSVLLLSGALPAWGWSQGWDWDEDFSGPPPVPGLNCDIESAPECPEVWS